MGGKVLNRKCIPLLRWHSKNHLPSVAQNLRNWHKMWAKIQNPTLCGRPSIHILPSIGVPPGVTSRSHRKSIFGLDMLLLDFTLDEPYIVFYISWSYKWQWLSLKQLWLCARFLRWFDWIIIVFRKILHQTLMDKRHHYPKLPLISQVLTWIPFQFCLCFNISLCLSCC